jgi:hypothetical protein
MRHTIASAAIAVLALALLATAAPAAPHGQTPENGKAPGRPQRIISGNLEAKLGGQARHEYDALTGPAKHAAAMAIDNMVVTEADQEHLHFNPEGRIFFADPGFGIPGYNGTDVLLGMEAAAAAADGTRRMISDQPPERVESNGEWCRPWAFSAFDFLYLFIWWSACLAYDRTTKTS